MKPLWWALRKALFWAAVLVALYVLGTAASDIDLIQRATTTSPSGGAK